MRRKVTVVGAGMTGGTIAQRLAETGYIDVALIDVVEGLPQGKALDLAQAAPIAGYDARIVGTNAWGDTAGSDVVVITSGVPRKPGMSREELLNTNAGIVREVALNAVQQSPEAVLIVFTNPMDAMCHVALAATGLPSQRVIGQGGMLDSARYRAFIARELGVSAADVHAYVLGGHTEATMVPVVSSATVGGLPLTSLLSGEQIQALVERTRQGGAEV
ncbi:MAG: malate dehydrogenase, partial [Dehalococcoidia bacterium]